MGKGFAGVLRTVQPCAKATKNHARTPFRFGCLGSPTPKARGSPPPAAAGSTLLGVVFFILYTILRDAAREDSNSCKGDRRLRRKQGAEAGAAVAEGKPRPRGAARCGHRNPYSARCLTSRRAKKPLRGFFRVRLGESPRRQQAVLFGHCSFLFDHKNSSAGRGHNGRGARCKKHKIIFSCANTNWPVSVQGDIQSPGPGALPEV